MAWPGRRSQPGLTSQEPSRGDDRELRQAPIWYGNTATTGSTYAFGECYHLERKTGMRESVPRRQDHC